MPTIHRSSHFTIEHHQASRYVRLIRTATPFASLEEVTVALRDCEVAVRGIDASNLGILLDWRLAQLSADAQLHQLVVDGVDAFAKRFARRALLVVSTLGKLQVARIVRDQSHTTPVIFDQEAAAIEYVTSR